MTAENVIFSMGVLLFMVAIMWGIAYLVLKFELIPGLKNTGKAKKGQKLLIKEILSLDTKRRLVKIEDENMEHLILLGVNSETHIHSKAIKKNTPKKATDNDKAKD